MLGPSRITYPEKIQLRTNSATPTAGPIMLPSGHESGTSVLPGLQKMLGIGSEAHTYTNIPYSELRVAKGRIEEFSAMRENWDGYGALRISDDTKRNALHALETILHSVPMPDITPNVNGTLSLEWESPLGVGHLEIGRTRFSLYITLGSSRPILADGQVNQLGDHIGQLVARYLFPAQHGAGTTREIRFASGTLLDKVLYKAS